LGGPYGSREPPHEQGPSRRHSVLCEETWHPHKLSTAERLAITHPDDIDRFPALALRARERFKTTDQAAALRAWSENCGIDWSVLPGEQPPETRLAARAALEGGRRRIQSGGYGLYLCPCARISAANAHKQRRSGVHVDLAHNVRASGSTDARSRHQAQLRPGPLELPTIDASTEDAGSVNAISLYAGEVSWLWTRCRDHRNWIGRAIAEDAGRSFALDTRTDGADSHDAWVSCTVDTGA